MISLSKLKIFIYLLLVVLLCYISYGKALSSYFWKDDWAWLWSSHYNPKDFFGSTVGENWIVRTGVFMHPYVLFLHKHITNIYHWQLFGLFLKILNSILIYFLTYTFTKKHHPAIWGSLLYASYSGGIESYTWHKLNAVATCFIILGFTMYNKFLASQKIKLFLFSYAFFILAMCSYMGRSAAIAMVSSLAGILMLIDKSKQINKKSIFIALLCILIPYIFTVRWVSTQQKMPEGFLVEALKQNQLFFGIIGNLLKNPWEKIPEIGYLANFDAKSQMLGYGLFGFGIIVGILYLFKRTKFLQQTTYLIGWIYLFYLPNWIYGGGGITTFLSSGHRYLAVSAIGIILLCVILLQYVNRKIAVIIVSILIIMNLKYSAHLIELESSVRNRGIVEPVYQQLYEVMKDDNNVQLIIIDTPNKLASFVVGGWYPYTYAYHAGLRDVTKFPTVVSNRSVALSWACAKTRKEKVHYASLGGFGDNQSLAVIDPQHVYGWSLDVEGHLTNQTDSIRSSIANCLLQPKQ